MKIVKILLNILILVCSNIACLWHSGQSAEHRNSDLLHHISLPDLRPSSQFRPCHHFRRLHARPQRGLDTHHTVSICLQLNRCASCPAHNHTAQTSQHLLMLKADTVKQNEEAKNTGMCVLT